MPSRPIRITDLSSETGAHVLNQNFRELTGRMDDIQKVLNRRISGNPILTFGAIAPQTCKESTAFITGANQGLVAHVNPVAALGANLQWSSYVSKQNQVTIRVCNPTAGSITPNVVKWQIVVS